MRSVLIGCVLLACTGGVFCQNCSSETIQDLQADASDVGVVRLSWQPIRFNVSTSFNYLVQYRPLSQSVVRDAPKVDNGNLENGRVTWYLRQLLSFTTYTMSVRLSCDSRAEGPASEVRATTSPSAPSANVSEIQVFYNNLTSTATTIHLVRLQWTPLNDTYWNGLPLFYDVSLFRRPDKNHHQTHRVHFPSTTLLLSLSAGKYGVTVDAVNEVGSANILATREFIVGEETGSPNVGDYPYFYIIIPGIVFLAFIIVITIVIFKKVHESRKQSVSYVRDINDKVNLGGFNNMMPMRELSPQSPNTSTSLPVSSSTITNSSYPPAHHLQHPAQRPLPLSPITPALIPAEDSMHFSMGPQGAPHMTTSASAGALKLSTGANHPGPLPSLTENVELSGAYPIARTMTNQSLGSVFSPNSVISPPTGHTPIPQQQQHSGHPHHRGRSNTMGGIPSPYEVPDTNGNTLPHDIHRPSSAHPTQRNNSDLGASFPPPPTHSPPPLTHSSSDMRSRVVDEHMLQHGGVAMGGHHHHHTHPHQQHHPSGNTLPRTSPNQRSFSTSAAHGRMVTDARGAMTSMRSEGNIPSPPDNDAVFHTQSSTGAENTVYIQPPLDSDIELQSTSSYGEAAPMGRRQSADRERPGHAHHYPPQSRYPGMLNGPLDSGEHFNNHMDVEGMVPSHMANPHHEHSNKDKGRRESMFSETSTELSITSGSEKETSPSGGWDREHKVARSDVGAPRQQHRHHQRHMRSSTPPERDFQANGFV